MNRFKFLRPLRKIHHKLHDEMVDRIAVEDYGFKACSFATHIAAHFESSFFCKEDGKRVFYSMNGIKIFRSIVNTKKEHEITMSCWLDITGDSGLFGSECWNYTLARSVEVMENYGETIIRALEQGAQRSPIDEIKFEYN